MCMSCISNFTFIMASNSINHNRLLIRDQPIIWHIQLLYYSTTRYLRVYYHPYGNLPMSIVYLKVVIKNQQVIIDQLVLQKSYVDYWRELLGMP